MSEPERIDLLLPDGRSLSVERGATALDVARAIGPRLADAAVGAELDGRRRRPARAAASRRPVPRLHRQGPRGRASSCATAPSTCWPTRSSGCGPRSRSTPAASGPQREVPVRLPLRARRSRPRTSRRSKRRCARSSPRAAPSSASRSRARRPARFFGETRREPQGRAPRGHSRRRADHPLPPRRVPRPLPRPARAAT